MLPVAFERPDMFDVMVLQHPAEANRFHYVLDWPIAIDPGSDRGLVSGYHEMENLERTGYYSPQMVESTPAFLGSTNRFVLVTAPGLLWLPKRVLNNPEWKATRLDRFNAGFWSEDIWLAERR